MTPVPRLDYSKPPPQYVVEHDGPGGRWCWDSLDPRDGVETMGYAPGPGQDAALAAAWTHYKAHNDPPGMCVFVWPREKAGDPPTAWCVALHGQPHFTAFTEPEADACRPDVETQVRAAAWAWYDRRLVLAEKLDHVEAPDEARSVDEGASHMLTWSDDQVAEVERWLVDSTAELPEVLRG